MEARTVRRRVIECGNGDLDIVRRPEVAHRDLRAADRAKPALAEARRRVDAGLPDELERRALDRRESHHRRTARALTDPAMAEPGVAGFLVEDLEPNRAARAAAL